MNETGPADRLMRSFLLFACLAVFLLIPLRILSYGYKPGDDALRHSAHAVDNRNWSEVILVNPVFRPEMDSHPGWHRFLRLVHDNLGLSQQRLVDLSVILAFLVFGWGGMIASGNPVAWLISCAVMSVAEPDLFQRLTLGRPMFFSMAALVVILFLWTRPRPLRWWVELVAVSAALSVSLFMHPSVWYLWALPAVALGLCGRWRSLMILGIGLVAAILFSSVLSGWYNTVVVPLVWLKCTLMQDVLARSLLVTELQPSGGPTLGLIAVAFTLFLKRMRGGKIRDEVLRVDFCVILIGWVLGLYVLRFWGEWCLPAMAVWICRQIRDGLGLKLTGLPRRFDTVGLAGVAAAVCFLGLTADIRGRYTVALGNRLLSAPVEQFASELPEDGGILYSTDMGLFYSVYHRLPHAPFRYAVAFESGIMPPEDLKILRKIQVSTDPLRDHGPWFDKMTPKDRIAINLSHKPEWPGIEFHQLFSSSTWIGRKSSPEPEGKKRLR